MKQRILTFVFAFFLMLTPLTVQAGTDQYNACWGQASAVFAQMGEMGKHASQQPTPHMGLHNLAVALYDAGVIADDSIATLGAYVASELGLSIDACME